MLVKLVEKETGSLGIVHIWVKVMENKSSYNYGEIIHLTNNYYDSDANDPDCDIVKDAYNDHIVGDIFTIKLDIRK